MPTSNTATAAPALSAKWISLTNEATRKGDRRVDFWEAGKLLDEALVQIRTSSQPKAALDLYDRELKALQRNANGVGTRDLLGNLRAQGGAEAVRLNPASNPLGPSTRDGSPGVSAEVGALITERGAALPTSDLLTLSAALLSPGFSKLSDPYQRRFVEYSGQTNEVSTGVRQALGELVTQDEFQALDDSHQALRLVEFMSQGTGLPKLVASLTYDEPRETLSSVALGPPTFESHEFKVGTEPAVRYEVNVGGQQIPVHLSAGEVAAPYEPMAPVETLAQCLAMMPEESRALISEINVESKPFAGNARIGDTALMSTEGQGTVTAYPSGQWINGTPDTNATSLIHEAGHVASYRQLGAFTLVDNDPDWVRWKTAQDADLVSPSTYARTNALEDFAESYALYQNTRTSPHEAEYRAMFPQRFKMLDELIAKER